MNSDSTQDLAVGSEGGGSGSVVEVLRQAREKVASGWTQRAFARNARGEAQSSLTPGAACWCSFGAIHSTDQGELGESAIAFFEQAIKANIVAWNDYSRRKHEEVIAAFDKAIELAASPAQAPALPQAAIEEVNDASV